MISGQGCASLLFAAYLFVCTWQDNKTMEVYDVTHIPGIMIAVWMAQIPKMQAGAGVSLLAFALVQYVLFRRMYGDADVMCFLICALSLGDVGSMAVYLLHMLVTYVFLGVHQALLGNVAKDGNLKRPVPMIRYILMAYIVVKIALRLYN